MFAVLAATAHALTGFAVFRDLRVVPIRALAGETQEITAAALRLSLIHIFAQHGAERLLEQVGGGMCTADSLTVSRINRSRNLVLNGQRNPENQILWQQLKALRKTNVNWASIS